MANRGRKPIRTTKPERVIEPVAATPSSTNEAPNMSEPIEASAPIAKKTYGQRPSRTPLADRMNTQASHQEPGFVYRLVNDKKGRVELLQTSGWEVVTDGSKVGDKTVEGGKIPGSAVTRPVGDGVVGVLMRKPIEWHDEDMKPVYDKAQRVENTLSGKNKQREDGFDNLGSSARTSLGTFTKTQ